MISANTSRNTILFAYLSLGVGIVGLSFSAIFASWANSPGTVTSYYRMACAVVLTVWPFFRRIRSKEKLSFKGIFIAGLGGLFFAGHLALWNTGLLLSGATNPTLLANTAPVWVGIGALVWFGERQTVGFWSGLMIAFAGAAIILGLDISQSFSFGLGSLLGLSSGVFYAGYFLVTELGRRSLDSIAYFWLAAVSSTAALFAVSLLLDQPLTGYSTFTYVNFLALGLITQVIGYWSVSFALGYLPASIVAPTLLVQPVLTAVLAAELLGEAFSRWQILGGVALLAGVFFVHHSRKIL